MYIVIAPDSFKGSLSASQAAQAISAGVRSIFPTAQLDLIPMADGGEGTVEALVEATGGTYYVEKIHDPLGRLIEASWGILGDQQTAVVEVAATTGPPSGPPSKYTALHTGTHGVGELIVHALERLHSQVVSLPRQKKARLIIALGGSMTTDGGHGALSALGIKFLDAHGQRLKPGGASLSRLVSVNTELSHPLLEKTEILMACDVDNPLYGECGAAFVYAPQKGASLEDVVILDSALRHYAEVSFAHTGKDVAYFPGAGAAGGLGAGLLFYSEAQRVAGVELVLEYTNFYQRVATADLVLTGEGWTDGQTCRGKAPIGVAKAAKHFNKPVICLSGGLDPAYTCVYAQGIDAVSSIVCDFSIKDKYIHNAAALLKDAAERVCRLLAVGTRCRFCA